ncbi:uncharacterized protein BO72DRAFT_279341 [Aspergillus fijiensis CBS 313.89]|uniref:Uncharacterized protein n=1 Tax=Aspergillus fijiensis CBS 313.89 TaxID=1448319 RepID=A0A8G1RH32_9EURO|nr:uncharacterized protein BO72DRAFT_279341 [Aspergillus fijiensis CBS 313.89]RAK72282.1 hypothetical protein BO72DRAFT_279341 [Aspergillus fijiensis CBS 313.89]
MHVKVTVTVGSFSVQSKRSAYCIHLVDRSGGRPRVLLQKKWLTLGYRHPPPPPPQPHHRPRYPCLCCIVTVAMIPLLSQDNARYLNPWGLSKTTTTQQCRARVDPLQTSFFRASFRTEKITGQSAT